MPVYHKSKENPISSGGFPNLPDHVQVSLREIIGKAKEGLLALSVAVGLDVVQSMMEAEVTEIAGPKGKHNPERTSFRHGSEKGSVVLGGRKVAIRRPRVRTIDGREVKLKTYEAFQDERFITETVLEHILYGLSIRHYKHSLEPIGEELPVHGTSKSTISRRFIYATRKALEELLSRPLGDKRFLVLVIDGVVFAGHTVVAALGITDKGEKEVLGLWEGATENAAVCRSLLTNLVERGLKVEKGILVVIDGSKALRAAVKEVFGNRAVVQRCQVHKKRNVLEHLPKGAQEWVGKKLEQAWSEKDYHKALTELNRLADALEDKYPGAARSLREGLEETLTVTRLGLPETLWKTLRSTNVIETAFDKVRVVTRNVKRWRNGMQVLRWAAAGLLQAEKGFNRIKGYRELPLLATALLEVITTPETSRRVKTA
ncbi:IS256 family transposase [Thermanaeromonas sp.]|uniref:IS256 family transposase n=1 Tax=Thermanaeromonas sp. TaxID=2003697 RepID=UPI002629F5B7|nr:IS256 family transposase [Thermanaeromonas sp.]